MFITIIIHQKSIVEILMNNNIDYHKNCTNLNDEYSMFIIDYHHHNYYKQQQKQKYSNSMSSLFQYFQKYVFNNQQNNVQNEYNGQMILIIISIIIIIIHLMMKMSIKYLSLSSSTSLSSLLTLLSKTLILIYRIMDQCQWFYCYSNVNNLLSLKLIHQKQQQRRQQQMNGKNNKNSNNSKVLSIDNNNRLMNNNNRNNNNHHNNDHNHKNYKNNYRNLCHHPFLSLSSNMNETEYSTNMNNSHRNHHHHYLNHNHNHYNYNHHQHHHQHHKQNNHNKILKLSFPLQLLLYYIWIFSIILFSINCFQFVDSATTTTASAAATTATTTIPSMNDLHNEIIRVVNDPQTTSTTTTSSPSKINRLNIVNNENYNNNNLYNDDNSPNIFKEYVCSSIDIRNTVKNFRLLENCTVVEGFLRIVLIDNGKPNDYENITFPKLREITDYLLVFRVSGLLSLKQMFPNLSVIRGRLLLHNYAFVIYEMLSLQEIGLKSLTTIVRGDIRIEKNPNLCFVDTVDWSRIAKNFLISKNKDQNLCPNCDKKCPRISARHMDGRLIGDNDNRVCWTHDICQKHYCSSECESKNRTCSRTGECCPEQCLSGCIRNHYSSNNIIVDNSNANDDDDNNNENNNTNGVGNNNYDDNNNNWICFSCKKFRYKNHCYDKCPNGSYAYLNRRCLSKNECHELSRKLSNDYQKYRFKAFNGECDYQCPVGYEENTNAPNECVKCEHTCPKICDSTQINNIASAQSLKGCTKINGSLEIYITDDDTQIVQELQEYLKDLVEITGYLRIARSFPLKTLNFLKNLKLIRGDTLERNAYSLLIFDNPNLQDLWTFNSNEYLIDGKKRIQIQRGQIFVHLNPKLCYQKIVAMGDYMDGLKQPWDEIDVSKHSNGDKVPCNVSLLDVEIKLTGTEMVIIRFENFANKMDDQRSLVGYLIYTRETEKNENVSIFDNDNTYSTNNEWTVREYDIIDNDNNSYHEHLITNLKPFTRYALYIKTYTINAVNKGAQSDIKYFQTRPDKPSQPLNLWATATKSNEIKLGWQPPSKPNGIVTHYRVTLTEEKYSNMFHYERSSIQCGKYKHLHSSKLPTTATSPKSTLISSVGKKNSLLSKQQNCTCDNSTLIKESSMKRKKIRPNDIEQSITFEDTLLNIVYVKRIDELLNDNDDEDDDDSNDGKKNSNKYNNNNKSNLNRKRRYISDDNNMKSLLRNHNISMNENEIIVNNNDLDDEHGQNIPQKMSTTSTIMKISPTMSTIDIIDTIATSSPLSSSSVPISTTTLSPSSTTMTFASTNIVDTTPNTSTPTLYQKIVEKESILFDNLKHFTEYIIEVIACQDHKNDAQHCSVSAITSIKTLPLSGADDINHTSITYSFENSTLLSSGSTQTSILTPIYLHWQPPSEPNGFILSYDIEYKSQDLYDQKCISANDYENNNNGYYIKLPSGNYSFRLRSLSLADYSNWTEPIYIYIDDYKNNDHINYIIISIIILILIIMIIIVYYKYHVDHKKLDYISVNPDYMNSNYNYVIDPKWEIPRDKITLIQKLGKGSFGEVFVGEFIDKQDKSVVRCAVKKLNEDKGARDRVNFLKEADIMKSFTDCHHVVKLLGICSKDTPFLVLMEIMPNGDLRNYLRKNRPDHENIDPHPPTLSQIYRMSIEIADGMAYLASKKFVHRDLAARNCMLSEDLTVKIGDFGMTRDICESDYYRKGDKGFLPVRWMSPESLKDGIFTTYSDVWAYGVVLWEIITLGSQPYHGMSNEEVLKYVMENKHMNEPKNCPKIIWQLMVLCWAKKPKSRPSFLRIINILLNHIENKDTFLAKCFYTYDLFRKSEDERLAEQQQQQAQQSLLNQQMNQKIRESNNNNNNNNNNDINEHKDETLIPLNVSADGTKGDNLSHTSSSSVCSSSSLSSSPSSSDQENDDDDDVNVVVNNRRNDNDDDESLQVKFLPHNNNNNRKLHDNITNRKQNPKFSSNYNNNNNNNPKSSSNIWNFNNYNYINNSNRNNDSKRNSYPMEVITINDNNDNSQQQQSSVVLQQNGDNNNLNHHSNDTSTLHSSSSEILSNENESNFPINPMLSRIKNDHHQQQQQQQPWLHKRHINSNINDNNNVPNTNNGNNNSNDDKNMNGHYIDTSMV